jgi:hypothetical protein
MTEKETIIPLPRITGLWNQIKLTPKHDAIRNSIHIGQESIANESMLQRGEWIYD